MYAQHDTAQTKQTKILIYLWVVAASKDVESQRKGMIIISYSGPKHLQLELLYYYFLRTNSVRSHHITSHRTVSYRTSSCACVRHSVRALALRRIATYEPTNHTQQHSIETTVPNSVCPHTKVGVGETLLGFSNPNSVCPHTKGGVGEPHWGCPTPPPICPHN